MNFVHELRSTFRPLIALLTIAAWMLASNHCAVGEESEHHGSSPDQALHSSSGPEHCPAPTEQDDHGAELVCCSALQAPIVQTVNDLPAFDQHSFVAIAYLLLSIGPLDGHIQAVSTEWDAGPPGSFAVRVIQRSLPSNAPPRLS